MKKTPMIFVLAILGLAMVVTYTNPVFARSLASHPSPRTLQKEHYSDTVIHVKFDRAADVYLKGGAFVSATHKDMSEVNRLTSGLKTHKKQPLFDGGKENITQQRQKLEKVKNKALPALNDYYAITLKDGLDIDAVVAQLKNAANVSEVYAAPLADASPVAADYSSKQYHFGMSPSGLNIAASSLYPGVSGANVRIADVEYEWNISHEDLPDAREPGAVIANGTPVGPFNDNDHGTAVLGVLSGDKNGFGVNGIVPDSTLHMVNTYSAEHGLNVANAIHLATQAMEAGDVILIEAQVSGPSGTGKYVPVEWVPSVYDAIKIAVAKGIHVVEAAGNGNENLDSTIYGSSFPGGKEDSGAIIVGAGSACNGKTGERLSYSTYGSRVNVQNHGQCVTTTGYGTLYNAEGQNALYTSSFSGTSSASAITAGIVAALSSSYETQKGTLLSPAELRSLLVNTGTHQDMTVTSGNIGPLPNMLAALNTFTAVPPVDVTPPLAPADVAAKIVNRKEVDLSWSMASDDTLVVSYDIYRNNILINSVKGTTYRDTGLDYETDYTYEIRAVDTGANISNGSSSVTVRTSSAPDTVSPTTPSSVKAIAQSSSQVLVSWASSTDNVGVTGYDVYRTGQLIASVSGTSYLDTGLLASTDYYYVIIARDAARNASASSAPIKVKTLAPPDTAAPKVTITSPSNGFIIGNSVAITASASDDRAVSKIELYIDGALVSSRSGVSAISYTWDTKKAAKGTHTVAVKAYDTSNNSAVSTITGTKR